MIVSIIAVAVGIVVLAYSPRIVRATEASGRAAGQELGGPWKWWNDPPPESSRARVQASFSWIAVLVVGTAFVVVGTIGVVNSL